MRKKKISVLMIVLLICLVVYTLSLFLPFLWVFITSFRSSSDLTLNGLIALPAQWKFENYVNAIDVFRVSIATETGTRWVYLEEMFLNSVLYGIGIGVMATMVPCIVAYLVAKYPYKFGGIIYTLVVILMLVPIVGNQPSMILILRKMNLYDTYFGMICLKANFTNMYFIIFYSTFKGLSNGYAEAAKIDGASDTKIMFGITFPLVKTTIWAIFILQFVAMWNDYLTPMIYYPSFPTVALGLMLYSHNNQVAFLPDQFAGAIIVVIPIMAFFFCFKKYLMGNLTMGGLKG